MSRSTPCLCGEDVDLTGTGLTLRLACDCVARDLPRGAVPSLKVVAVLPRVVAGLINGEPGGLTSTLARDTEAFNTLEAPNKT